ncbi:MAG: acyl-CoA dehydrogenase family protein [Bacteroidota bacterium]
MANQVLSKSYKPSQNFYASNLMLQDWLISNLSALSLAWMHEKLQFTGKSAATMVDELSLDADKNPPQLIKRDRFGNEINSIKFHPSYDKMQEIAIATGMLNVKWDVDTRLKFNGELHAMGFSTGYLFAMAELGLYCPLCMTDGVARLIDKFCSDEDRERLLPKIAANNIADFNTGAMFLTEKSGGSDVGANLVSATEADGGLYHLNGEKWFCSNANADLIMVLARTDASVKGTKGLSIFLVERYKPDGSVNYMNVVRLKDKLGVRSMASAEIILENTVGKMIGKPFEGFLIMAEMINLSRLYNSVAAVAGAARSLIEAYQFLCHRKTFGKTAIEHPLVRRKMLELGSLQTANFYLTWRTIKALDAADNGNKREEHLLRILTPMTKRCTAEEGVYIVRESMELMGGIGYIEESVLPKIMRDMMVLPIWEGAGNIMILDMIRASKRSDSLEILIDEISTLISEQTSIKVALEQFKDQLKKWQAISDQELLEYNAKPIFEKLTLFTKYSILTYYAHEGNQAWMGPALTYLSDLILINENGLGKCPSVEKIRGLMAWDY